METYIGTVKYLLDHVVTTNDDIKNHEYALYVLGWLGSDYSSIITNIT